MAYLTDRKRATGMGASGTGTLHHWGMTVSAVALVILVPLFICVISTAMGGTYEEVTAYLGRPYPAIVIALTMIIGFTHFKNGAQIMIEDYVPGAGRKFWLIATTCISYAAIATALYSLIKLAL